MKKKYVIFTSILLAAITVTSVASADFTAEYDTDLDDGTVVISDLESTGQRQTLFVMNEETSEISKDNLLWITEKDDGTAFTEFKMYGGLYSELNAGESETYYIRVGGSDGSIQTGEFTVSKAPEPTPTPTPEPTPPPVISGLDDWISTSEETQMRMLDWDDLNWFENGIMISHRIVTFKGQGTDEIKYESGDQDSVSGMKYEDTRATSVITSITLADNAAFSSVIWDITSGKEQYKDGSLHISWSGTTVSGNGSEVIFAIIIDGFYDDSPIIATAVE